MTAQVVLLAGPSGSGKSTLARRTTLPLLELDHFYRDGDDPGLPRNEQLGMVDWDDVRCWDADAAMTAITQLCRNGTAEVPEYDLASDRRTGTTVLELQGAPVFVAEGIFASELVQPCRTADLLADAIVVARRPWKNFARRLARDLAEGRKSPTALLQRGRLLMAEEPRVVQRFIDAGCRPLNAHRTLAELRRYQADVG